MLVQLLEREGDYAQCISLGTNAEMIDQLVEDKPDVVIVSALQPFALANARKLYLQIRARLPKTTVMVGLWNFNGALESVSARFGPDAQGLIVTNLEAALDKLAELRGERRAPAGYCRHRFTLRCLAAADRFETSFPFNSLLREKYRS